MTQAPPTWLGPFFGAKLSLQQCEVFTIKCIPHANLREEAALMETKWFDYRRLHPLKATYYLAECYNRAHGRFMAQAVDVGRSLQRGFKGEDFLDSRERLSFWRLRQLCDRLGVRYDFFLDFAMRWYAKDARYGLGRDNKGLFYAPRPAQILNNQDMITDAMLAWEEIVASSLQIARDPYFRVSHFDGSKMQLAHEAHVVAQIKQRRHWHFALHAALYVFDVLRIEEAIRQFGEECVGRAISEAGIA